MGAELLIILVLILINGLLSMSEVAVMQSKKSRLDAQARRGHAGAKLAQALHAEPTRFLSTVQIGITLVSILTGMFSGGHLRDWLNLQMSAIPALAPYSQTISLLCVVFLITFLSLVIGELVPKRIGMSHPEKIAEKVSLPMMWLAKATAPFIWLLTASTNLVIRLLGIKQDTSSRVTEEELLAMIDEGATAGAIDEREGEIIDRVILLGDKRINTLMTSRHDIKWLDLEDPLETNIQYVSEHRHSTYPVCKGSLDDVVGVLSVKDLFHVQSSKQKIVLEKLVKPGVFFPESLKGYQALEKFQASRSHFALVVDEYGTTAGVMTLTDVFDALVGDIKQEDGENIGYQIIERDEKTYLVDGQYAWIDFLQYFDQEDEEYLTDGYHTIAGYIINKLEALPEEGQKVAWNNMEIEVIDMDGPRVDKVMVTKLD
jgi:putative hemolysin